MSRPIIEVRGLSKRYRLGAIGATSLREQFHELTSSWRGKPINEKKDFWALRDVSFDVQPGEVVGIIGRNGAGKSTLLKILSRITEPTRGLAKLKGRAASLLEVGTGFHPELTGRENIFLNGAILGMTRAEVARKFDEIVSFAEVTQFIDTPVKRYSSGMYVRLAFAVAAHLEPEILIVDEVLAVGDLAFQRRCLGKMESVSRQLGRTVIFVSHNMPAVRQLCHRVIVMKNGTIDFDGATPEAVERYDGNGGSCPHYKRTNKVANAAATIDEVHILGAGLDALRVGQELTVRIHLTVHAPEIIGAQVAIRLMTSDGVPVLTTTSADERRKLIPLRAGSHQFDVSIPGILAPGRYSVIVAVCQPQRQVFDVVDGTITFSVGAFGSLGQDLHDDRQGIIETVCTWNHRAS